MNLWAVAMVRNEADVVEAFVRHNMRCVDGMAILDHGSADATPRILAALKAEGLPLSLHRADDPGFYQGSYITTLARECFRRTRAHFVLALDADEFIGAPSRAHLEAGLQAVPAGSHALHSWRTYVPTFFEGPFGPHCVRFRLREEAVARDKVILARDFLERPHEMVSEGNHWAVDTQTGKPSAHVRLHPGSHFLAHCPVRSRTQLENKVRLGYQAVVAAAGPGHAVAFHWRDLLDDLDNGVELTDTRLRLVAANYGVPRERWRAHEAIDLVEDPLQLSPPCVAALRRHGRRG
jgi:glycosyl transferase family 2